MKCFDFIKNPTTKQVLLLAGAAAAAILSVALVGQYGFDLYPCHLCLYQRYPYIAIILLSLVGIIFVKSPRAMMALALICGALFAVDAMIAMYHAGVEWGWFPGPSGCTNSNAGGEQTLEQMMAEIKNAPLVSCDQAMAEILGLSMAAWNAIAAIACSAATFFLLRKTKKD